MNNQYIDRGRLQIMALATDIGMPATNATVRVIQRGSPDKIIEEIITDISGQTPVITLPAPPVELSLEPENMQDEGGRRPYSEYDVHVDMEGYQSTTIEGIQILSDTTALQNVNLNPINRVTEAERTITIPDHTLWGTFPPKTPEDEVKPMPEAPGLVVLPRPVVPEYIIVHAGVPSNASAPNYWVPFKDYIKNVASCEIYSTWPTAAIEANILAIISFTLNRVYTEWYRGKGFYNFTITNSTAYDQAFIYQRNIFKEISTIVDYLFTTFITRPNIRQPLFTQYCDGRMVTCPGWMTQWGSKSLGDQGYNSVGILKYFYGTNIFLMNAERVAGVPSSFPGYNLQMGSTGQNVRTIQEQLNAISNNYPAIPKLVVDGIFGNNSRTAVETFQRVFQLPASGIVDFPTWYRISNVYVAVTRLAEL